MTSIPVHPDLQDLIKQHESGEIILDIYQVKELLNDEFTKLDTNFSSSFPSEEQLQWIKTLEDLLFVLNFHILRPEDVIKTFSSLESYNDCIKKFIHLKITEFSALNDLENVLIDKVILSQAGLEKLILKSEKVEDETFFKSLLRKAYEIHNRIPYQIKGIDYDALINHFHLQIKMIIVPLSNCLEEFQELVTSQSKLNPYQTTQYLVSLKQTIDSSPVDGSVNTQEILYKSIAQKLENLLFIQHHNLVENPPQESMLNNIGFIDNCFANYQKQISTQLEDQNNPNSKINFISREMSTCKELIITTFDPTIETNTLPSRAIEYLQTFKTAITNQQNSSTLNIDNNFKKIQTNISVEQLALLFRILKDENIIAKNTEVKNLTRAISNLFSTKKAEIISPNTLKNHFDAPTPSAIEFWLEKKQPIQTHLTKYKEKTSK
ncbi:hypothetical protein [Sunxiuqinia sp. sy24]|uniref:hypothetical protein n=1 Tax=Sunxiuqinia sp. sy24 TaxID=3461495 RepID=UPI0040463F1D